MRYAILLLCFFLVPSLAVAQEWEPVGNESFSAIAGAEDGSLLLIRSPGDILRSTDTGGTWQVVYHGGAALTAFRVEGNGRRVEGGELIADGGARDLLGK